MKQTLGSELSAQSLPWGLKSRTRRLRPELKSDPQPTEPPRHPRREYFFLLFFLSVFTCNRKVLSFIDSRNRRFSCHFT